jgi:hypothetical protein
VPEEEPVLHERTVVRDEHLFGEIGMADDPCRPSAEADAGDVAMLSRARREEPERIAAELGEVADEGARVGAGRAVR